MNPDTDDSVKRITVVEAHRLIDAGRGVLVDARDRRLYDNAHATGAISLPLSEIEAANGRVTANLVPPDRLLILYCA
ncbi:MAG: hypothetical protein AUH07_07135 [Gemmatimonadetes bacterium 13_2_20CM_70_9]|nr:MAG: hypothetical protein AUH07_07135 [Gemmatimonadetes bacterium 13_2_20CM_70_9]